MFNMRKVTTSLMFLSAFVGVPAIADSYTGYVIETRSSMSGNDVNFTATLVGLGASPTGPVALYRTAIDPTYTQMLLNAQLHQRRVTVSGPSPAIGGVYILK